MPDNEKMIVYGSDALSANALAATPAASDAAADVVAVFAGADVNRGQGSLADWVLRVDSATLGTSWEILKRGKYSVDVTLDIAASARVIGAISVDGGGVQLNSDPSLAAVSTRDRSDTTNPAATTTGMKLHATVYVNQTAAKTAGQALIRVLIGDGANTGAIAGDFVLTECKITISRVDDENSRA